MGELELFDILTVKTNDFYLKEFFETELFDYLNICKQITDVLLNCL